MRTGAKRLEIKDHSSSEPKDQNEQRINWQQGGVHKEGLTADKIDLAIAKVEGCFDQKEAKRGRVTRERDTQAKQIYAKLQLQQV